MINKNPVYDRFSEKLYSVIEKIDSRADKITMLADLIEFNSVREFAFYQFGKQPELAQLDKMYDTYIVDTYKTNPALIERKFDNMKKFNHYLKNDK